ncbi:purine-nucleoside phosphorylase [Alteribacillus persepolensis]|uniref:Purine nucleoside phosphorylase n=1 Tax=Alteribacillus persepolensis TaxID=568899 RepID=A0A1G7ZPA1_9BACI|nr:purine-nucleoside phosphorylase [Alteribacillus persepolensis]SDH10407.1 purine-nucleoside phosphorylase [Alteribacillus persepolensis]
MESIGVKTAEAAGYLEEKITEKPQIGLILGSGLGDLAEEVEGAVKVEYSAIPHFPVSTVEGHAGRLVMGKLKGKSVVAMQGRFHYYEGYSMQEVTFPVRVMKELGIETLVVTNACGSLTTSFQPGDLMIIDDHINMTGANPLIGKNDEKLGPRFPDMSQAYDRTLQQTALNAAKTLGFSLQKGVYTGISGPSFSSAAELVMLRRLGGDVVGMSTVPEVITARHAGLNVLGISCITDMAVGEEIEGISHEEVMETASKTKPRFMALVKQILETME